MSLRERALREEAGNTFQPSDESVNGLRGTVCVVYNQRMAVDFKGEEADLATADSKSTIIYRRYFDHCRQSPQILRKR